MSISIYYTAYRKKPLSPAEQGTINDLKARFSIDYSLEEYRRSGKGINWASFCDYDIAKPTEPGVIFEGATKLPDNSEEPVWIGAQH